MKKWMFSLAISASVCAIGLICFTISIAQDGCLGSGGLWLGISGGCEGGTGYEIAYFSSPLAIGIFLGIVLGVASACVQVYDLFINSRGE